MERNLVGVRGVSHSTVLNHLSSFRRLFSWRKKQAEFAGELRLMQPAKFGTDIFSTIAELYVSIYADFVLKLLVAMYCIVNYRCYSEAI